MILDDFFKPASTALLVIDKQVAYFDPEIVKKRNHTLPSSSPSVLESIDKIIELSRKAKIEVVWTQMVEDLGLSPWPISEMIKHDPQSIYTISKPGEYSFEFYGRTKPSTEEKVIKKFRYNAFAQTELGSYLEQKGVKTVILVGGYATRCVLSTAVGANDHDLFVIIPRGLEINQSKHVGEVETLYSTVDTIFGRTINEDEIVNDISAKMIH